jgi:hypothetical protein
MTNYRGRISRIIGNDVYVQVSALAVDQDFGPMDLADAASYSVDDYVLVAQIDGAAEDVVIVGKLLADLSEIGPPIVLPTTTNSFFVGQADGSYAWKTTAQAKTALGVDTNTTNIAANTSAISALQTEVQPVNRGGTGKTSYTVGNYIQATGTTTLSERTPTQVKSDLGLTNAITTAPSALPISTATQSALDTKWNKDVTVSATGIDFNTITTPGVTIALGISNSAASTNIPDPVRGFLTVTGGGGSTYLTQTYHTIDGNIMWTRTSLVSVPSWTPWRRLAVVSNDWVDLSLNADWEPYDSPGVGYRNPQYKSANGKVELRGFIRTTAVRGAGSHTLTTLSGLGPTEIELFLVLALTSNVTGAASTGTAHTHAANYQSGIRIDVATTGVITVVCVANQSLVPSSWLSLSGIYWYLG